MNLEKRCPNCGKTHTQDCAKCDNCGYIFIKDEKNLQAVSKNAKVLSIIALCFGIASICTFWTIYISLPLAAVSFILTLISKRINDDAHFPLSKKAFVISIVGGGVAVAFRVISLIYQIVITMNDLQMYL